MLLHLMFGEIMLRTTERHRLAGYVGVYFGEAAKKFIELITIAGTLGGMLAYLLVGGLFLKTLTGGIFGTIEQYYIILWALLSFVLFSGLKMVERTEAIMLFFMVAIITLLFVVSIPLVDAGNFSFFYSGKFLFPYGVTLFALREPRQFPWCGMCLRTKSTGSKKQLFWER